MTSVKTEVQQGQKPYKGMAMEGLIASWYARIRVKDDEVAEVQQLVESLLPTGGDILEVAPGPGYMAIELARSGRYRMTGLDISRSFVDMARAKAKEAGVAVNFELGNASAMPFGDSLFDLTICRAAFKNFTDPVGAIREMHRVLKPGGKAFISDLRRDATMTEIEAEVAGMGLNPVNAFLTRSTFRSMLLKNAYTEQEMRDFAAQTPFARCDITRTKIGMHVLLGK